MFQNNFAFLSMDDINMIDINYSPFNDIYEYMSESDESSLDDYDLDPDYIPDSDDSSNEDD
jgi:hypothetical protein